MGWPGSVRVGAVVGPLAVAAMLLPLLSGEPPRAQSAAPSGSSRLPGTTKPSDSASGTTATPPTIPPAQLPPGAATTTPTIAPPSVPTLPVITDCTTTLSGLRRFPTLTIPANQTWCLDPNVTTTIEMGGNLIVEGTLEAKPASPLVTHTIRFTNADEGTFVGGGDNPVATDHGLWVMDAGQLDLQGTPKVAWNRAGDDPSWSSSDELVVTPTAENDFEGFRPFTKGDPVPTAGEFKAEVLNLTRNVRIEGMPPEFPDPRPGQNNSAGRAHIYIRSTQPQMLKHVAIRYMGPRQAVDSSKSDQVLGRYGLHFHMAGDGSRGSVVEGVVARDIGAHSFVPHASHGITLRDTIAYDGMSAAYWWDPGPNDDGAEPRPNQSHDILYDRAVAAKISSCLNCPVNGFALDEGKNNVIRNSVAVGIGGYSTSAGYGWPQSANGAANNVWAFEDNVAHNNRDYGIFVWQNDGNEHRVTRFVGYRNGIGGVFQGAYINHYIYEDLVLWQNSTASFEPHLARGEFIQWSITQPRRRLGGAYGARINTSTYALVLAKVVLNAGQALQFDRWRVDAAGPKVVLVNDAADKGTGQHKADLTCWTLPGGAELEPSDFQVDSARPGTVIRVQQRDGDAYKLTPAGFHRIAAFASCA